MPAWPSLQYLPFLCTLVISQPLASGQIMIYSCCRIRWPTRLTWTCHPCRAPSFLNPLPSILTDGPMPVSCRCPLPSWEHHPSNRIVLCRQSLIYALTTLERALMPGSKPYISGMWLLPPAWSPSSRGSQSAIRVIWRHTSLWSGHRGRQLRRSIQGELLLAAFLSISLSLHVLTFEVQLKQGSIPQGLSNGCDQCQAPPHNYSPAPPKTAQKLQWHPWRTGHPNWNGRASMPSDNCQGLTATCTLLTLTCLIIYTHSLQAKFCSTCIDPSIIFSGIYPTHSTFFNAKWDILHTTLLGRHI